MTEQNTLTDGDQIYIARSYQEQLEEISLRKNTIIHLPTGSGKTYIAIRLIKRFREALKKPWREGGQRTFFLVNTVPLVMQQKEKIEKLCPVSGVGGYSGEDGVDFWDKSKWDDELTKNQVVVLTSQILFDMLTHTYIRIEDINLLIFDECHHAVDDHPMRMVMKHFEGCPPGKQPRVIGLTATLLNSNVSKRKVEDALRDLETTFHATIATVNELGEVLNYSTNPYELIQYYHVAHPTLAAREAIVKLTKLQDLVMKVQLPYVSSHEVMLKQWQRDISSDPKKVVKNVKNMVIAMIMFIEELGVYGGALSILAYITLLERLKRKASTKQEELLYTITITHSLEVRMILLDSMAGSSGYQRIISNSSDKVIHLLNVLKEYSPKTLNNSFGELKVNRGRQTLSAIIFTQQRFTAKVLYNLLKDIKDANPKDFDFVKHDFIVGYNMNPNKSTRENHYLKKATETALLKFRNSELNCLISTSVIEEGVDIPQCLLVLKFDQPLEYRSYIQSKGRARNSQSTYVIMVNEANSSKFAVQYRTFLQTEQTIHKILVGNTDNRLAPTEDDIQEDLYEEDQIAPYVTAHGRLSSVSAISLLSRYCSTLPHDNFTTITPMWIEEKVFDHRSKGSIKAIPDQSKRLITILLPIACPIKEEIKGQPFVNTKIAKRSAALNACIKLHQIGELDSVTLLPKPYMTVDYDSEEVKTCFPNWPKTIEDVGLDVPKAGGKRRMRKYRLQFPSCLATVASQKKYYLHVIKMSTNFEKPTEPRDKALYDFLQAEDTYGFLTQKPLHQLCSFPMFTKVGEVTTSLELNYAVIELNEKLFGLIRQFHFFIFSQVLSILKKFVVFDGKENCMFVVPVKLSDREYDINWDVMLKYKSVPPVEVPSDKERQSLQVTENNYKNCVVSPWYRETIYTDRYIVSNVLEYMTPKSFFDSQSYGTFEDYYREKYNLEIIGDKSQPLLEVRNITTGMNCLLPRAATINALTDKQKKMISAYQGEQKLKGFLEIFIAEFCIKFDFPGVLWFKAMILPSILHRVYMLLVAQELLNEIARDIKYGKPTMENHWEPIKVNMPVAIKSLMSHVEEPTPVSAVDRIHCPMAVDAQPQQILSMTDSLYQLQKKRIQQEFPWDEKMEPVDIERNLSTITVMDIECYDKFMSVPIQTEPDSELSPPMRGNYAAITAPPVKYNDKLDILLAKPKGKGPELRDILAALTTIKSNDTFNLERAETLGDSFLKFAATLYLYHKFPKLNEGQLTNIKCRLISNRNLYYAGQRINLGGRMKVESTTPTKDFLVPGFFVPQEVEHFIISKHIRPTFLIGIQFPLEEQLSGKLSKESWKSVEQRYIDSNESAELEPEGGAQNVMQCYMHHQAVSDKSVADCVEALVGTYLSSGGILGAVKFLQWMRIIPAQDNFEATLANPQRVPTGLSLQKTTLEQVDFLLNNCRSDVEKILNYEFKDPCFLLEALSHASYIQNRVTRSYERLEFLGDAILDFLITTHIFENCCELKPGEMTDLRSALVNNVTFAAYVVKLGLHKFLCSKLNPNLDKAIVAFVDHQQHRKHEIIEDVLYLIDEEDCKVAQYIEVPKVLSDIFESLAGAIYLDSGGDLQAVWSVVYRIMHKEIDAFSTLVPKQPVRVLHENIHACPVFGKVIPVESDDSKVMIQLTFTKNFEQFKVHGVGTNKAQAKRAAAKLALKILSIK